MHLSHHPHSYASLIPFFITASSQSSSLYLFLSELLSFYTPHDILCFLIPFLFFSLAFSPIPWLTWPSLAYSLIVFSSMTFSSSYHRCISPLFLARPSNQHLFIISLILSSSSCYSSWFTIPSPLHLPTGVSLHVNTCSIIFWLLTYAVTFPPLASQFFSTFTSNYTCLPIAFLCFSFLYLLVSPFLHPNLCIFSSRLFICHFLLTHLSHYPFTTFTLIPSFFSLSFFLATPVPRLIDLPSDPHLLLAFLSFSFHL